MNLKIKSRMLGWIGIVVGLSFPVSWINNSVKRTVCIGQIYKEVGTNKNLSELGKARLINRAEDLEREGSSILDPTMIPFYGFFTDRYDFHSQQDDSNK